MVNSKSSMRLREKIINQHLASQQSVSDVSNASKYSHSSLGSILEHASDSDDFEADEPPKLNIEESKESSS